MQNKIIKCMVLVLLNSCININAELVITSPKNGSTVNTHQPDIEGTATSSDPVNIKIDGKKVGTAFVFRGWSLRLNNPLRNGTHTILATQSNGQTATSTFNVKANPLFVTIDLLSLNGVVNTNKPTFTGTASFGESVTVKINNIPVGRTTANSGVWSLKLSQALPDGTYVVSATTSLAGKTVTDKRTFFVNTNKSLYITFPTNNSTIYNNDKKLTIRGKVPASFTFSNISVKLDGILLGVANQTDIGDWSITTKTPLTNGKHTIVVTQSRPFGTVFARATSNFTLVAPAVSSNSSSCCC